MRCYGELYYKGKMHRLSFYKNHPCIKGRKCPQADAVAVGIGIVMKKASGLTGKYLIMYLSCLFPRSRKIYIFGAWLGEQFADNPKISVSRSTRT